MITRKITLILIIILVYCFVNPIVAQGEKISASNTEIRLISDTKNSDLYQLGPWTYLLLFSNLLVLAIGIFSLKLRKIRNTINSICNFELSKKVAFTTIMVLLFFYIVTSVGELQSEEYYISDYPSVKNTVEKWRFDDLKSFNFHVKFFFLNISLNMLGNIRIVPFLASISLLVLTYYFTFEITKKRFAGIIAIIIVIQSHLFLEYDTTSTYDNLWILFYLLSLLLIMKRWYFSHISYILSIFSKFLTVVFLPMTLFFTYDSDIQKKKKTYILISYGILALVAVVFEAVGVSQVLSGEFYYNEFLTGFKEFSNYLESDGLIVLFILPLTVGLFIKSRQSTLYSNSILIFITVILLTLPLLTGLVNQTNQPYRLVPLVIFFAIGVGLLVSKNQKGVNLKKRGSVVSYLVFSATLVIVLINLTFVIFPSLIQGYYRVAL